MYKDLLMLKRINNKTEYYFAAYFTQRIVAGALPKKKVVRTLLGSK